MVEQRKEDEDEGVKRENKVAGGEQNIFCAYVFVMCWVVIYEWEERRINGEDEN